MRNRLANTTSIIARSSSGHPVGVPSGVAAQSLSATISPMTGEIKFRVTAGAAGAIKASASSARSQESAGKRKTI
jgi:hypothetical protein